MTKRRLVWVPDIQILDIHKLLSHTVNEVISKDPLLFLTIPYLELLQYNEFKQVSLLYIEDVKLKFQIYYKYKYKSDAGIIDKFCIELEKFSHINQYNGAGEYDRYRVNMLSKMLYDDVSTVDPYEEDLKTNKGLEILYKLKLIRLEK